MVMPPALQRGLASANYLFLMAMLGVIIAILAAALFIQLWAGELPCPLCLLERLCMIGICFGILQTLRFGFSNRHTGVSLIFALLLLVIAARQTLLDIYPRPGHEYIGSAIFGIHMPVWSVLIALAVLAAFAIRLAVLGDTEHLRNHPLSTFPRLFQAGHVLGLCLLVLCGANLVSVGLQCGVGECHTYGYALLGGDTAPPPAPAAPATQAPTAGTAPAAPVPEAEPAAPAVPAAPTPAPATSP